VANTANDARRREAFESLRVTIGTRPEQIVAASRDQLVAVASHGIMAEVFGAKLRSAAEIALGEFDGDLGEVVARPVVQAKRALRRFPGIGEPGTEKILLFLRRHPFLAPESNGLRVLVRLGAVRDGKSYAVTYATARDVAQRQLGDDFEVLLTTRYCLRRHGQELCRNKTPSCGACPLNEACPFP
jgi:endonuclease-3